MADIAPSSFEMFQQLSQQLQLFKPSQYPGEDLSLLVNDFYKIANPLSLAGHFLPNYTMYLVNAALTAGGNTNHPDIDYFQHGLYDIQQRLNRTLLTLPSLKNELEKNKKLTDTKCTYKFIGAEIVDLYTVALTQGRWPPAVGNKDKNNAPSAYILHPTGLDHVTCHYCGEKGHYDVIAQRNFKALSKGTTRAKVEIKDTRNSPRPKIKLQPMLKTQIHHGVPLLLLLVHRKFRQEITRSFTGVHIADVGQDLMAPLDTPTRKQERTYRIQVGTSALQVQMKSL